MENLYFVPPISGSCSCACRLPSDTIPPNYELGALTYN